jgi:hypothetical protein
MFITDREEPYRVRIAVWMDLLHGLVVGQQGVDPDEAEGALGRTLRAATERPAAGPPRRPQRIRVANASLAAEVRAATPGIPVEVAPTPELDKLLEFMLEQMAADEDDGDASYLEEGRVSAESVAGLFAAARLLFQQAPWRVASDGQVLRMDIPALGVEGACVSIIGALGESLGFIIFPSLEGFEAFAEAGERLSDQRSLRVDLGTGWLALSFEKATGLPAGMRREAMAHGWPVADPDAYPTLARRERDGAMRPLVERDVEIATACAASLAAFCAKHGSVFEAEEFEAICESWFDERDLEVRYTIPYEAYDAFEIDEAPRPVPETVPRVGRNDPCPCGSGRKYKKCHLASDEQRRASQAQATRDHDLDGKLVNELGRYAKRRFGSEWGRFVADFDDPEHALQLAMPWSLYVYRVQGRSVAEHYVEERGSRLTAEERAWLTAQLAAWLSVWEVEAAEPGKSVTLRDLLSGEQRHVREASASQTLVVRDAVLARVVDYEDVSLMCGAHPRPLPPLAAAEVVRRARGRLRRKRAVPVERLRDEGFGRYLIEAWEDEVAELDERASKRPDLRNSDGHRVVLTADHFEVERGGRARVEGRLAGVEGLELEQPGAEADDGESVYVFSEPGRGSHAALERTLTGRLCVTDDKLRLDTNSRERADALRARVEKACPGLVRHVAREHTGPFAPGAGAARPASPEEVPPAEAQQLVLEYKRRHYADWPDHPLPALGGLTPRAAIRTAEGRRAVDTLLKDMENTERRSAGEYAFDFGELRRALGLK